MWHVVVEVACAEYDEHVEVALLNEVEHVVLAYDALLDAWSEVVVDELRCDAFDRLLACGVDLCEYHLVELAERIGEVAVEGGAGI